MKRVVYGLSAASVLALSAAMTLSPTGWAQAPADEAPGNSPTATAPVAPAKPTTSTNPAPQANTAAKPPALASSPVCPPVHKHVARVQHHYRRHLASNMSMWETRSETTEVEDIPVTVVEQVPTQLVEVVPPPVYMEPPPPPAPYVAPGPVPWAPAPWQRRWERDWW
ncbi:MAG TPA: hypothetical protein VM782_05420 [Stellaceae bacterium]|nr:hypothetical protein [Stellaceae bacterium]